MLFVAYDENNKVVPPAYSQQEMIPHGMSYIEVTEQEWTNSLSGVNVRVENSVLVWDAKPPTVADYDNALEAHLKAEREARGYTTREPDTYINSSVARWHQDAVDWIAHKDAVMLYGLEIENKYIAGEPVPTLDEFKELLPKITWTIQDVAE